MSRKSRGLHAKMKLDTEKDKLPEMSLVPKVNKTQVPRKKCHGNYVGGMLEGSVFKCIE